MSKITQIGSLSSPLTTEDILTLFPPDEGGIELIYGLPRNGKSTHAVRVIMKALEAGIPVISNIPMLLDGIVFDDRDSFRIALRNFLLFRRKFYKFDKSLFRFIDQRQFKTVDDTVNFLSAQTDVVIVWDEGWYLLPATDFRSLNKMEFTALTGHFARRIVIVTQRPTAIATLARGNVNTFYHCEKIWNFLFPVFKVSVIHKMVSGEMPDEDEPSYRQFYFRNRRYFGAFDTHYMRGGKVSTQDIKVEVYELDFVERFGLLFRTLFGRFSGRQIPQKEETESKNESLFT
jgi:hypothetical protein